MLLAQSVQDVSPWVSRSSPRRSRGVVREEAAAPRCRSQGRVLRYQIWELDPITGPDSSEKGRQPGMSLARIIGMGVSWPAVS